MRDEETSIFSYKSTVKKLTNYMHEHKLRSLDASINYLLKVKVKP